MKNRTIKLAVITALSATMMGCGSSGSSSSSALPDGRVSDTVVEGLGYVTIPGGQSGKTDRNGI